ncbi:hypothetical protein V8E53_003836 [Lactarius tabidus]
MPTPAPPPQMYQPPYYPPQLQQFHRGYPGPVNGGQYQAVELGMNTPPFYYNTPHTPFNYQAPYPSTGNAQPWGYGQYLTNPLPDQLLNHGDMLANNTQVGETRACAEAVTTHPEAVATHAEAAATSEATNQAVVPNAFKPTKTYPNKQISEGVWEFVVDVHDNRMRRDFTSQTDMSWKDCREHVIAHLDSSLKEVCLQYRINSGSNSWVDLTCEADWKAAMVTVAAKAPVAQTRAVAMEVKDVLQVLTKVATGKKKEKRNREEDIPSEPSEEIKHQYECLQELKEHLHCASHSKPGMEAYCWIELASDGIAGGHREFSHQELTLWARYMADKKATKYSLPNIKRNDRPPSKKPRAAPEVHVAVNFTPMPGGGIPAMQGSYIVSGTPILQQESASAPGPLHLEQACNTAPTQSCSAPMSSVGRKMYVPKAKKSLVTVLSNCVHTGRVPTTEEILTLMDSADPQPDRFYRDSLDNFLDFGIHDALDIHNTQGSNKDPVDMTDTPAINKWQSEVKPEYVEEIEDDDEEVAVVVEEVAVVVEEVEEVDEESTDVVEDVEDEGDDWVNTWVDDLYEV